jgi:hypothetical protein
MIILNLLFMRKYILNNKQYDIQLYPLFDFRKGELTKSASSNLILELTCDNGLDELYLDVVWRYFSFEPFLEPLLILNTPSSNNKHKIVKSILPR